ncbi:hypothetical protein G4G28_17940 [Massilia sp. Dwa41.01b]|uniref:hypothetical protein n=1 Tax=unclassified Massilia TaxID=2609279 RepID=UPI001604139E|nr:MULTISPECIES: hypothetical protein [unclassified Massilia]QNA89905.1 hypothetical protein G4G28_17940 [Massilia sp. Dwa41.01b]QNB00790.1 hypothetical protein G4G31_21505 [Massilia sp. Se16.2.3]
MNIGNPGSTFRGLPLTDAQESEVRHYIHAKQRCGKEWDTPELQGMLTDMLDPPEVVDDDMQSRRDSAECATVERSSDTGQPQERNG